jgi:hypothetical protein
MKPKRRAEADDSARLSRLHRRALYGVCALLWVSGACWLYFTYLAGVDVDAPALPPPALLELHGAAAMAFLLVFGSLLPAHLPNGWRKKRQRPSGSAVVGSSAILVVSGWGLYYFSQEGLRSATSVVHSALGILLPFVMAVHVWRARRLGTVEARDNDSSYPVAVSSTGR